MAVEAVGPGQEIFAERGAPGVLEMVIERRDRLEHGLGAVDQHARGALLTRFALAVERVAKEQPRQRPAQAFGAVAGQIMEPRTDLLADGIGDPELTLQYDVAGRARATQFLGARDEIDEAADQRPRRIVRGYAQLPGGRAHRRGRR